MAKIDYPSINVEAKSNEENMQITKGYLNELAASLNYQIDQFEGRIAALEAAVSNLEGDE